MIPINNKANLALRTYLKMRGNTGNDILFLNRFREPVGNRGVQKMLRKYLIRAGIGHASIHTLRHTFGVYQLAKGESLKRVKDLMGLENIGSTSAYPSLAKEIVQRET